MSKIVLVETISMFRHVYAVEIDDEEHESWACNDVVREINKDNPGLSEIGQKHIDEHIFSHRVVDEEEYLRVFDEISDYLKEWSSEEKKKFIFKRKNEE